MSDAPARQPHAVLDLPSRRHKGRKIERLLGLAEGKGPIRLLEVGTGSGGIAHYFATHPRLACRVDAVDVVDQRQVVDGFHFTPVEGVALPFPDGAFDVVLSNHVIEHVGGPADQRAHLLELRRVLKPQGVGYLAVPNRWMLVEPHFRLPFLSWLPQAVADTYVRMAGKGSHYDCRPLRLGQLERMLADAGFSHANLCVPAWRETLEIECPGSLGAAVLRAIPDAALRPLKPVIPTLIYRLAPA